MRLTLLGIGAMASPRYQPAGLLVSAGGARVMLDGGPGASPERTVDAWLVCDARSELQPVLRRLAAAADARPVVGRFEGGGVTVEPLPVEHTSHPTFGYLISQDGRRAAWVPELWRFPDWAAGVDLLFADAAGWDRPIRFRGGVGGHAAALETARVARAQGVHRLVLAHVGRPTIRALAAGARLPFGEVGVEGHTYLVRRHAGHGLPSHTAKVGIRA